MNPRRKKRGANHTRDPAVASTLDSGSHIAGPEPLPEAGATQERTLEAVGSRPMLGVFPLCVSLKGRPIALIQPQRG